MRKSLHHSIIICYRLIDQILASMLLCEIAQHSRMLLLGLIIILNATKDILGSELQIFPKVATVNIGDSSTFRCIKKPNAELPIGDWMHRPIGNVRRIHIYSSALDDIENSYEPFVSVRNNQTTGEYYLVLNNIQLIHAGTYYCVDSDKNMTTAQTQLFVINVNELRIVPRLTTVRVGGSATLHCMKEPNAELPIGDWKHRQVGERRQIHIYSSALDDIENSYEPYVSVRNNQTTGEYDLLMTNIQSFHAGTYFCIDSNREQTTAETELIVVNDSTPSCNSNISHENLPLGENDCGWEPDKILFNCSVQYYGNHAPALVWSMNNDSSRILQSSIEISHSNEVTSTVILKSSTELNGSFLDCRVESPPDDSFNNYRCKAATIILQYAYEVNNKIAENISEVGSVKCEPNTSFSSCTYTWSTVDNNQLKKEEIVRSRIIESSELTPARTYQCSANCTYKNRSCQITANVIRLMADTPGKQILGSFSIVLVISTVIGLVIVVFIVAFIAVRFRYRNRKFHAGTVQPETVEMMTSLLEKGENSEIIVPEVSWLGNIELGDEKFGVLGVGWLPTRIYVVCRKSSKVHVFQDKKPFAELKREKIHIKNMKDPNDMATDPKKRIVIISDKENKKHWRIKIRLSSKNCERYTLDGKPKSCVIDGEPRRISVTPKGLLLVVVKRDIHYSVEMYSFSVEGLVSSFSLSMPTDARAVWHAAELPNGNFIVSYEYKNSSYSLNEVSSDGKTILRTLPAIESITPYKSWFPLHLAIDEHGQVLIADFEDVAGYRVFITNSTLTAMRVLLANDDKTQIGEERINKSSRLCYLPNKHRLLVGHWAITGCAANVSVYNLTYSEHVELDIE